MKKHLFSLLLFLLSAPLLAQTADTRGREFVIAFLPNFGSGTDAERSDLRIYLSSAFATIVAIRNNMSGEERTIDLPTPQSIVEVDLVELFGPDMELPTGESEHRSRRTFLVEAENEVTLTGVNVRQKSADAFVAYPTDVLRGRNWVTAYGNGFDGNFYDMPSQFAIVGTENGTTVEIIPSTAYAGHAVGVPFTITLGRGDVYLAQATLGRDNDVTGTEINATAPVAVFAGNRRTSIPRTLGNYRDHLIEQIPPTDAWGTEVVVVPFFPIDINATEVAAVRILSGDYENTWAIDGVEQKLLERGEFVDVPLNRPMRITAAASILVTQYDHSSGIDEPTGVTRMGDPSMMIVPAVDNYDTLYTFQSIPHPEFKRHYINIVAPDSAIASLRLDGEPITALFTRINGTSFRYLQLEVRPGAHLIRAEVPFGVQVYGYGEATSYAYTGGFVFRRLVTGVEVVTSPPGAALAGIFPNPAAGTWARLSLQLQQTAPVTIELVDSRGNLVLRPMAGEIHAAGAHEVEIDLIAVPSGTYHLRVTAGEEIESRLLVIAR